MINRIQTDIPLKMIHVSIIHVLLLECISQISVLFSVFICLKNGKFANFVSQTSIFKLPLVSFL